jgi:hypothetical protein
MEKIVRILIFFMLSPALLFGQFLNHSNVQLLLYGKVTDEYTGNPVGAIIEFRTPDGKKFKIKSDSVTGKYQQVFTSGSEVEAIIYDWDVVRERFAFKLPDTNKYAEIEKNFVVKHLKEGLIAYSFDCFEKGTSNIVGLCENQLKNLDEVLRFNRNVKFEIRVTAFDTYIKTKKIETVKKTITEKKKKKTITEEVTKIEEPPLDKIKALVDSRLPNIEKIVSAIPRGKGRLFVVPFYESGDVQPNDEPKPFDVFVVVKELKNILEK